MIGILAFLFVILLQVGVFIALVWISWVYFDRRYRGRKETYRTDRPEPGFQMTTEVFIDPKDEKRYRVYYNPSTGERQYVEEP
jgi:membrane protein implicated in regulation of membrane protease activity